MGVNLIFYVSFSDFWIGVGGGGNDIGLDINFGVVFKFICIGGIDGFG